MPSSDAQRIRESDLCRCQREKLRQRDNGLNVPSEGPIHTEWSHSATTINHFLLPVYEHLRLLMPTESTQWSFCILIIWLALLLPVDHGAFLIAF